MTRVHLCFLVALVCLLLPAGAAAAGWGTFELLGREIEPGEKAQLDFMDATRGREASFIRGMLDVRVLVARGKQPGPTLCLIGAIHGDEINGVEIARHVLAEADAEALSGTLIAVPAVNVWGFRSKNRYLSDRRDLNRAFPGSPRGSTAGIVANALFERVIRRCDALIDLHTGSNERTNLPQIRVDLENADARKLALYFDVGVVLGGAGPKGSLRRAATDSGIPAIIYESGGPNRFERNEIVQGIAGVTSVMKHLGMIAGPAPEPDLQRVYRTTSWVRSPGGGIFLTERALGDRIRAGDVLGTVTDPDTSARVEIVASYAGTLIGMAYPQVVLPGYGLFHIARAADGLSPEPETIPMDDLEPEAE